MSRVQFHSPQFGGLSLGMDFVSSVGELFAVENPAICIEEGDDQVTQISLSEVQPGRRYLVVDESELHEGQDKLFSDEKPEIFIMRMRYREQQLLANRRAMVARLYKPRHVFDVNDEARETRGGFLAESNRTFIHVRRCSTSSF